MQSGFRRVIEGEGLGGFARRVTVNESAEGLFRPRTCFFAVDEAFANKIASGTKYRAQVRNRHDAAWVLNEGEGYERRQDEGR